MVDFFRDTTLYTCQAGHAPTHFVGKNCACAWPVPSVTLTPTSNNMSLGCAICLCPSLLLIYIFLSVILNYTAEWLRCLSDSFTVSLHSTNVSAVQRDCQWYLKNNENNHRICEFKLHCNKNIPKLYLDQPIRKERCQPIGIHALYPFGTQPPC